MSFNYPGIYSGAIARVNSDSVIAYAEVTPEWLTRFLWKVKNIEMFWDGELYTFGRYMRCRGSLTCAPHITPVMDSMGAAYSLNTTGNLLGTDNRILSVEERISTGNNPNSALTVTCFFPDTPPYIGGGLIFGVHPSFHDGKLWLGMALNAYIGKAGSSDPEIPNAQAILQVGHAFSPEPTVLDAATTNFDGLVFPCRWGSSDATATGDGFELSFNVSYYP